jgi:hypothetical protein
MWYILRRPRAFWISVCNLVGLLCSMVGVVLLFWYALPNGVPGALSPLGPTFSSDAVPEYLRYTRNAHIGLVLVLLGTLLEAVPPLYTAIGSWWRHPMAPSPQTPLAPPPVDSREARERRRFKLDVAAVVVAGATAVFLLLQQHTMQGQLDEMRAEQRAWVYAETFIGKRIGESGDLYYVPIQLYYHNTGHLPAFFVFPMLSAEVIAVKGQFDLSSVRNDICDDYRKRPLKDTDVGETLFPAEEHRGVERLNAEFKKSEWIDAGKASRATAILVIGR